MIVSGIIFCWALQQVDFVMAYLQAFVETDIYMELPQGIKTATGNSKDQVLKLLKNIYAQKQVGRVWNSFLVDKLTSLGYTSSLIASEVQNKMIFMGHQISSCHVPVVGSFFTYFKIISSSWNCWYDHLPKYFNITLKLPNMTFDKSKKHLVMSCYQLFLPLKVTLFCTISRLVLNKYHTLLSQQVNFSCPNNNIFMFIPWSCERWKKT